MLADLKDYYRRMGIAADDFRCPFKSSCSRFDPERFTTAKEAFVSSGYENHTLPRILFLSLDSGSASQDSTEKTLENVRRQEEECRVLELPRNKHWFRTHELAYTLLCNFKPDLTLENAKHYFAHTNSAKCCQNNPQRKQAAEVLFDNCRIYIPGEIEILAPAVLITQGDYAHRVVEEAYLPQNFPPTILADQEMSEEIKLLSIEGKSVIWIRTYHPRNPNSKINREHYPIYAKCVFEVLTKQPLLTSTHPVPLRPTLRQPQQRTAIKPSGKEGNYIYLDMPPDTPFTSNNPSRADFESYEYMTMVQLCDIAENCGRTRGWAHDAFGGDRGKYSVEPARMARVAYVGKQLRKYVLVSAVSDFFNEHGIPW